MAYSVNRARATELAEKNNLDVEKVGGLDWWKYAINTELQNLLFYTSHGLGVNCPPEDIASAVALRKLELYPDWYQRLKRTEDEALRHWRNM